MNTITIFTIGYTKKSAREFFNRLLVLKAKHLLDIRLKNTSQLSGFTKRDDLKYFLKELINMEYHELPEFAPNEAMLKEFLKNKDWNTYVTQYQRILETRKPEKKISSQLLEEGVVFLCSEVKPDHCHRRLAAEWVKKTKAPGAIIVHL